MAQGYPLWAKTFPFSCTPQQGIRPWREPSTRAGTATTASRCARSPEVTLEEDLARRDLTINAMAQDRSGPYRRPSWRPPKDLAHKGAAPCIESLRGRPVRILRLARLRPVHRLRRRRGHPCADAQHGGARRSGSPGARTGMAKSVARLDGSAPLSHAGCTARCGALARLLPEVDRLWGVPQRADYHPRWIPACT